MSLQEYILEALIEALKVLRDNCHQNSKDHGFWDEHPVHATTLDGVSRVIDRKPWNFGEKIALIHSELSEMFEAWRKNVKESEKPIDIIEQVSEVTDRTKTRRITAIEEEVADVFIRMFDLCGKLEIDVGRVVLAKHEYNKTRPHMHGGRKC